MAEFADGLVQGDAAKKIYVARSKSVDEKTVTAANENALTTKVQGEEQDGWSVAKKNSKSVRVLTTADSFLPTLLSTSSPVTL